MEYGIGKRGNGVVLAYVEALSRPPRDEIQRIEAQLRERLGDNKLASAVRLNNAEIESSRGPYLAEWTDWRRATKAEYAEMTEYKQVIRETVSGLAAVLSSEVHFRFGEDVLEVLIEISGPKPVTREDARQIEDAIGEALQRPIRLYLWYRNDFIVTTDEYTTYDAISIPGLTERGRAFQEVFGAQ